MAIARVQSATGAEGNLSTSVTATLAATATADNLLVAFHMNRAQVFGETPAGWTQTATIDGDNDSSMFHKVSDGTETGITVNLPLGNTGHQTVSIIEYSGTVTADVLDGVVAKFDNAIISSHTTADLITTNADDVLVAGIGLSGDAGSTIAWTDTFGAVTQVNSTGGGASGQSQQGTAERIVSATATYSTTASWLNNRRTTSILAAFKAAAGATPQTVSPTGITSAEAFGSAAVTPGAVTVSPTGITSAEVFGTPTVTPVGPLQTVSPTGIASAEVLGTPFVSQPGPAQTVSPVGIVSAESFGTPVLTQVAAEPVLAAWRIIQILMNHPEIEVKGVPRPRPGAMRV